MMSRRFHVAHSHRGGMVLTALPRGIDPRDAEEIDLVLAQAAGDGLEIAARLSWRLRVLVQRSIPPRVMEPAPVQRAARLRFADGTTVLVKGSAPGDLGILAMAMKHWSVKPTGFATSPEGIAQLRLAWPGANHRLSVDVVGLDQPD